MQSYSVLASYYDKFTRGEGDYAEWAQYIENIARELGVHEIVDLACGTGKMTAQLVKRGFTLTGIDASEEMLSQARVKTKALFVRQDMRKLTLAHPSDMAVCVNDGVNYLSAEELEPFFARVSDCLKMGAPFVFDVSTPYKLRELIGDRVLYRDYGDETLLWCNSPVGDQLTMELTLFVREGELYRRYDEKHTQYVHCERAIIRALENTGFVLRQVTDSYGKPLSDNSTRWTFYALKR